MLSCFLPLGPSEAVNLAPLLLPISRAQQGPEEGQRFANEHALDLKTTLEDSAHDSSTTCQLCKGQVGTCGRIHLQKLTRGPGLPGQIPLSRGEMGITIYFHHSASAERGISEPLPIPMGTNHQMPRLLEPSAVHATQLTGPVQM